MSQLCEFCGVTFDAVRKDQAGKRKGQPLRFCSRRCRNRANVAKRAKQAWPTYTPRPCEHCGQSFDPTPKCRGDRYKGKVLRFCSRTCKNRAMSKHPVPDPLSFMRPCERCGAIFDSTPASPRYERPKRFCEQCFFAARGALHRASSDRSCLQCGKSFYVPQCHINDKRHRGKYCSRSCAWEAMRNGTNVSASRNPTGERSVNTSGYIELFMPSNPVAIRLRSEGKRSRRARGWVLEHRYVIEQLLGRPLLATETVHHKDGNRGNNDPSNLEMWVKPQPTGVRVSDLIAYVVTYHREACLMQLNQQPT